MSKFCGKCGGALSSENTFCPNCGNATKPTAENRMSVDPVSKSTLFDATTDENATVKIGGNKIKAATIIKVVALALCVLFFLPMFSVNCSGITITFTGLNAAFGKTISFFGVSEKIDGNLAAIFLLIIPAALFASLQFKKNSSVVSGKLFKISTGLSALGLLGFIIFTVAVNNEVYEQTGGMVSPQYTFWYYLSILLYLIAGAISIGCILSVKKRQ